MSTTKLSSYAQACNLIEEDPEAPCPPDRKAAIIFLAACALLGLDALDALFTNGPAHVIAHNRLTIAIIPAVVGDWIPDWNNSRQKKWGADFLMNSPGFRLRDVYYGLTHAYWTGGSRLCCETEEQMRFVATNGIALFRDLHGGGPLAA